MIAFLSSIDARVLQTLYAIREPHAVLASIGVSELGSAVMVVGLAVALALWLGLRRKFALVQGVLLAVATSGIATFFIKMAVARARPPVFFRAITETDYSFPSAHAALAVAFYGFVAFIVLRSDMSIAQKRINIALLSLLVLLIGFSRLYLGVHYLSDVLGGYVVGTLCLWLAIWATRSLERRGGIVPAEDLVRKSRRAE